MNKKTIKILVIISFVIMAISAFTNIFPQESTINSYQEIYANFGLNLTAESVASLVRFVGIINLIGAIATSVYALLVLFKAKKKSAYIAPGILLIIFNGLVGIVAGIMMLCIKQEAIDKN